MSDNRFVDLSDWIQIKVSGPQTIEYLNGIITLDLQGLDEGEIYRSAFLTPNAKLRSIFWLKIVDGSVIMYAPAEFKNNLVEDLLKYKLSMDVKLEDITEEVPTLYLIEKNGAGVSGFSNEKIGFTFANLDETPLGRELSYNEFEHLLVKEGIIPPTIMMDQNPYEIGIADVISLEKGCFLGQEPISRMYHRGNPRKFVYLLELKGEDRTISLDGENVGEVLVRSGDRALAYIRRQVEDLDKVSKQNPELSVLAKVGHYPKNDR